MTDLDPRTILATPMSEGNDAGAATIRDYLGRLLSDLWDEGEGFSGKRPFGNSGWEWELYAALAKAGHITGVFDQDGDVESADTAEGRALVADAIKAVPALLAEVAKDHDELRDKRTDLLNIRGILSPQGRSPSLGPVVPMPLGEDVAPAVEWLANERDRLRNRLDHLADLARTADHETTDAYIVHDSITDLINACKGTTSGGDATC